MKVATPVDICVEKLSPMPWILPVPCGRLMAWLETPVLSPPAMGSASTVTEGLCVAAALEVALRVLSAATPADGAAIACVTSLATREDATCARSCVGALPGGVASAEAGEAATVPAARVSIRHGGNCAWSTARESAGAVDLTASATPATAEPRGPSSARAGRTGRRRARNAIHDPKASDE